MTVNDIQKIMALWAPPAIAWERDNPGLQCGDPAQRVRGILVALEATAQTVAEARRRKANLIISHHPLLFRPLRSVTPLTPAGRVLKDLLAADIALYSAHTNLDFTRGGTSFALADLLKLKDVQFLESPYKIHRKIVTFVPAPQVDRVASAMAEAGAGRIGNYEECSFRTQGTGMFRGNDASRPVLGERGKREQVPEVRLEMLVPEWSVERVVSAMRREHPYEEVAYDVYPLENRSTDHGMGVVGMLRPPVTLARFLRQVKRALGTGALRWTGNPAARVERVAACGGSGGELLEAAIRSGADVFVTADVKYHSFHEASGAIALVDAGHFETEAPVLGAIVHHLKNEFQRRRVRIPVYPAERSTNPVRYV
jgi:dinuclear metal center YbgI/SA1388 family protein